MKINQENIRERVDFVLNRLLIVFFFAILVLYASREVNDLDLWLHLKTGEVILQTKAVPTQDYYSFTISGKPWINHEWLFQATAAMCRAFGGWDALIFMQNAVLIAVFLLLYLYGIKHKNHIFIFIILYMTLLTLAYRFTIRPDIFSILFLTLYLFVIKLFSENKSRAIWLLPLFQVFWVNMHGFFFTGPLLVFIVLIAEIIKRSVKLPYAWNQTKRLDNRQMVELMSVFGALVLASFINPCGLKGAAYPFSVLGQISGQGKVFFQYIQELAKPITLKNIFDINSFTYYKAFILVSLFSFRINQKNINISDLILWLSFLCFSFIAVRNIAYFGIIAAIIILNNIDLALKSGKQFPFKLRTQRQKVLLSYALIAFLFYYPAKGAQKYLETSTYNFDTYELKSSMWGLASGRYPEKAVNFLLRNNFPDHMFNDFNSGAYLIGRTFPLRHVFIDGRTELYGPVFFTDYVSLGEGRKEVIEKTFARYYIQGVFLSNPQDSLHQGLLRYLFLNPAWRPVYFDESAVIFLKNTRANAALIKKFAIDLKNWTPPKPDLFRLGITYRYPTPYVYRGRLLHTLGCYKAAASEAKAALDIMPNCAEALKFMADFYFYDQKNYLEAFKYARNALVYAPGDFQMRSRLAMIYHMLKEDKKALKVIDAMMRNTPKASEAYYIKAWILQDSDTKTAKTLLATAIKISAKEPRYHVLLGDLWAKEGDMVKVKKEWTHAFEYDSANETLRTKLEQMTLPK